MKTEITFRNLIDTLTKAKDMNIVDFLAGELQYVWEGANVPLCHDIPTKILKRFITMRLRMYGLKTRKEHAAMDFERVYNRILMGLGDQIAQNFIDNSKTIDLVRTMQFAGIGLFISGPATRTWYGILDKYIGSKGYSVAIKKVACDQLLFAPTFIAVLLVTIGICQGKDIEKIKIKVQDEYNNILINNYKLWPMVQLINFSIVPLHYQVLVVQLVALFWNSYISYKTSLDKHNEFR